MNKQNILIAEFMDAKVKGTMYYFPEPMPFTMADESRLNFHDSWDWLMASVEKINSIVIDNSAVRVTIRSNATIIEKVGERGWEAGSIITGKGMLLNTFEAVVEFLEWYNNNLKK
jgi:hypothetical protein